MTDIDADIAANIATETSDQWQKMWHVFDCETYEATGGMNGITGTGIYYTTYEVIRQPLRAVTNDVEIELMREVKEYVK